MSKLQTIIVALIIILVLIISSQICFYFGLTHKSNIILDVVKKRANDLYNKSLVKDVDIISSNVIKMDSWEQKRKFLVSSYITTKGILKKIGKQEFPKKFSITLMDDSRDTYDLLFTDVDVKKYVFYEKKNGVTKEIALNDLKMGSTVTVREIYEVKADNTPTRIDLEIIVLK